MDKDYQCKEIKMVKITMKVMLINETDNGIGNKLCSLKMILINKNIKEKVGENPDLWLVSHAV